MQLKDLLGRAEGSVDQASHLPFSSESESLWLELETSAALRGLVALKFNCRLTTLKAQAELPNSPVLLTAGGIVRGRLCLFVIVWPVFLVCLFVWGWFSLGLCHCC